MIRNGDPEYINVIIKRYGFEDKTDNINAYSKDVLSGWDHWKFPISIGKAKISIEILKTVDKYYRSYTKCKFALDFDYFNQVIKDKVEMDLEFIEVCIDILTDVEILYMDTSLKKQITNINIFLEEWKHYSKYYHFYEREIYKKVIDICNKKCRKLSNLLKQSIEKQNKKIINNNHFDYEYYREKQMQDDDEEQRIRDEELERERELEEQEREHYEFYYGED